MSNTSNGPALKGSKMWMQKLVEEKSDFLNKDLEDTLKWISPCKPYYKEFQLNNLEICKKLGISQDVFKKYWPSRQPQWDGIAVGEKGTLYLFEAKSHKSEISSSKKGKSEENNKQKYDTIMCTASEWFNINNPDEALKKIWCEKYFQISNRISFCRLMQENTNYHTVVVFLNFVNDSTWKEKRVTSEKDWENHYGKIFEDMKITTNRNDIKIINFDLNK